MARKPSELPIAQVLRAMDTKQRDFYIKLTDSQKKAFSGWLTMRYASSVEGAMGGYSLYVVNEVVNRDFSDISSHPELIWLCLTAAATGKSQKHTFIHPGKRGTKNRAVELLREIHPHLSGEELELMISINNRDELGDLARQHGITEQQIREAFGK